MKHLVILAFVIFMFSCLRQQAQTAHAQQPKNAIQPSAIKRPQAHKTMETPLTTIFNGHYSSWFHPLPETSGYGAISIHKVDEKNKRVSFSTMLFGKRNDYETPFIFSKQGLNRSSEKDEQHSQKNLMVNTKMFNFSLDGKNLWINLYDGAPQTPLIRIAKQTFKYAPSKTFLTGRPVINRPPFVKVKPPTDKTYERVSGNLENASKILLEARHLENLQAVDLEVMKNGIYARHGAAFKDRRMTDFFSENEWYSPIFTVDEVGKNLTKLEIKNINLIGRFEKNAKRHYFGR